MSNITHSTAKHSLIVHREREMFMDCGRLDPHSLGGNPEPKWHGATLQIQTSLKTSRQKSLPHPSTKPGSLDTRHPISRQKQWRSTHDTMLACASPPHPSALRSLFQGA